MCRSRRFLWIALAILAVAGGGCSSSGTPARFILGPGTSETAPVADSPQSLLRLFEWCYANRDVGHYRTLFSDDFRFVFGALDPSGNAYRNSWTREQELEYFTHLVSGGGSNPPATSITLLLDRNFQVSEDPRRPGPWHRLIRTSVTLKVVGANQVDINGFVGYAHTKIHIGRRYRGMTIGLRHQGARLTAYYGHTELDTYLVPGLPATRR